MALNRVHDELKLKALETLSKIRLDAKQKLEHVAIMERMLIDSPGSAKQVLTMIAAIEGVDETEQLQLTDHNNEKE